MCDKCNPNIEHGLTPEIIEEYRNKPYLYIIEPNILYITVPRQMNGNIRIASKTLINYCPWCGRILTGE